MSSFLSRLWAHVGTLLMGVLATLSDTGVIHITQTEVIVLNAITAFLVSLHLVSEKVIDGLMTAIEGKLHLATTQARTAKATSDAAAATAKATSSAADVAATLAGHLTSLQ